MKITVEEINELLGFVDDLRQRYPISAERLQVALEELLGVKSDNRSISESTHRIMPSAK